MMSCFITGLMIDYENAFTLDFTEACRAVSELKSRLLAVEKIIEQFSEFDDVKIRNWQTGEFQKKRHRRLVSRTVAEVMNKAYSERKLFVPLKELKELRNKRLKEKAGGGNE